MENEQKQNMQAKMPKEPMILSSKKKWFWIGIVIAIIGSISGLIFGIALYREKNYKKEGLKIITLSIVWLIILYSVSLWMRKNGYYQNIFLPTAHLLPVVK